MKFGASDGDHPGLLCSEAIARRDQSRGQQISNLFGKVGSFYPERSNFRLTPEVKEKFTNRLKNDLVSFAGRAVKQVVHADEIKLIFDDGSWVCYRL